MAVDLEGILGAELMSPAARDDVIDKLLALPVAPEYRRYLWHRWALAVGYSVTNEDKRIEGLYGRRAE